MDSKLVSIPRLQAEILKKHEFNKNRPYRHGGKVV